MEIIEYFSSENKDYWLSKIAKSDWPAGEFLHTLLKNGELTDLVGKDPKVLLLVDGKELVSFCTLSEKDDIQPTDLTPWIGWVYTFPTYRKNRYSGKLLQHCEELAKAGGHKYVYISTNHDGLYEKYGYVFYKMMKDIDGEDSKVYRKPL